MYFLRNEECEGNRKSCSLLLILPPYQGCGSGSGCFGRIRIQLFRSDPQTFKIFGRILVKFLKDLYVQNCRSIYVKLGLGLFRFGSVFGSLKRIWIRITTRIRNPSFNQVQCTERDIYIYIYREREIKILFLIY